MSPLTASPAQLAPSFAGHLILPADAAYNDARRVHNGLVDKRPAVIARCSGVADIVDALQLAKAMHLEVAVRGGGHNVAGRATIDGGVMIGPNDGRLRSIKATYDPENIFHSNVNIRPA